MAHERLVGVVLVTGVRLTPDLKPVVGGTYFPPRDNYGRRGFPSVLRYIAGV